MIKSFSDIKGMAILWAVDKSGKTVYKKTMSLYDYYEELHPWDKGEWLKKHKIVLRGGLLVDSKGQFQQNFSIKVDPKTGNSIGGTIAHGDGTCNQL